MPSGTGAAQHGAHLQPWSLSSGPGSTSRYSERLHAQGATSGTGSLCALQALHQALGSPSGTGRPQARGAPSPMGCALRECLCLSGKGSAFRNGEYIEAWGVPSGMVSGFSNWTLCAASSGAWRLRAASTGAWSLGMRAPGPGGAAWDSVSPSLSFPRSLCGESTEPGGCVGFCVSLSLSFPYSSFRHWDCGLQALGVTSGVTSVTRSDFGSDFRPWE